MILAIIVCLITTNCLIGQILSLSIVCSIQTLWIICLILSISRILFISIVTCNIISLIAINSCITALIIARIIYSPIVRLIGCLVRLNWRISIIATDITAISTIYSLISRNSIITSIISPIIVASIIL